LADAVKTERPVQPATSAWIPHGRFSGRAPMKPIHASIAAIAAALILAPAIAQTPAAQGRAPRTPPAEAPAPKFTTPDLPQAVKTAKDFVGDYKTPRLKSGKPDLGGFFTNATVSRMDRPSGYPLILNDEQAAALEGRALFNVRMKTEKAYVDPKQGAP